MAKILEKQNEVFRKALVFRNSKKDKPKKSAMSSNNPDDYEFKRLSSTIKRSINDIKDFHFIVEQFAKTDFDVEEENDLNSEEKWKKISDVFKGFGYNMRRFSPSKCRDQFFQWSSFYAKNYNKLNGKLEPELQQMFDKLKIVHILDFKKIWIWSNCTHILLREISEKTEIKEYVANYRMTKLTIRDDIPLNSFNPESDSIVHTFESMGLSDDILRGIHEMNYIRPSFIQQKAIVPFIKGKDVVAQAQSGTGKTASFAIAVLQRIDITRRECQALILAPTRELAQQIGEEIKQLGKYTKVRVYVSIGGYYAKIDIDKLKKGYHIVVGTPARILHMMDRYTNALDPGYIKMFVLDEADQLLDLNGLFAKRLRRNGFKNQIFDIYRCLNSSVQIFVTSATLPKDILQTSQTFMRYQTIRILMKDEDLTLEGLQQYYVLTENKDIKYEVLLDLYRNIRKTKTFEENKIQTFVYCNERKTVDWIIQKLENKEGIEVPHMHSSYPECRISQQDRELVLNDFKKGFSRFLITTDVLGRGIDVKEVEFVINFDLPKDRETYMHRVGRSGRFGRTGKAISLVTESELAQISELEKFYNTEIKVLPNDIFQMF